MQGLIDTTLREGAQTAGISFSLRQKRDIVQALVRIGIEEIELGIATSFDRDLPGLMASCRAEYGHTSFSLWSMCRRDDIEYAAVLEPDILSLSIPVSDLHIFKKLRKSRGWVLRTLREALAWSRDCGIKRLSLGLEDATRAEDGFLTEVMDAAVEGGVSRIRFADTVGIASPLTVIKLLSQVRAGYDLEFGIHTHNDFGMATANCLTALEAGADWADVTVMGLGERAGNARLEEAAAYLRLQKGRPYRTECLRELSALLCEIIGEPIAARRPVIGRDIFTCETGLHIQGLERDPETYEPYPPHKVGAARRLLYGRKTGRHNLRRRLLDLARPLGLDNINELLGQVRDKAAELGRPLEDAELTALCRQEVV
ncbi:LeuA family protein [Desulfobacterota bacterium M19]